MRTRRLWTLAVILSLVVGATFSSLVTFVVAPMLYSAGHIAPTSSYDDVEPTRTTTYEPTSWLCAGCSR